MVTIGQKATHTLHFGECAGRTYTGTVVWIHPAGRFYIAEFIFERGRFREAFYFPERGGNE